MSRCIRGLQTVSDFGFTHVVNNQRLAEFREKNVADTSGLNFLSPCIALRNTCAVIPLGGVQGKIEDF